MEFFNHLEGPEVAGQCVDDSDEAVDHGVSNLCFNRGSVRHVRSVVVAADEAVHVVTGIDVRIPELHHVSRSVQTFNDAFVGGAFVLASCCNKQIINQSINQVACWKIRRLLTFWRRD